MVNCKSVNRKRSAKVFASVGPTYEDPSTMLVCDTYQEFVMYMILADTFMGNGARTILLTNKDGKSIFLYADRGCSFEAVCGKEMFQVLKDKWGFRWVYLYDILFYPEAESIMDMSAPKFSDLRDFGVTESKAQKYYNTLFCRGAYSIDINSVIKELNLTPLGESRKHAIAGCSDIYDMYLVKDLSASLSDDVQWGALSEYILSINCSLIARKSFHIQYEFSGNKLNTVLYVKK